MQMHPTGPGPLVLEASLHETIWGGRNLERLAGKPLPNGAMIGESWETEVSCVVREGPHTGTTLGELVRQFGVRLLGTRTREIYGDRFPLLTKFLDAHEWLSVQVHPDDTYARTHEGGKLGKTEAWYILHAEPGARLAYGVTRPVDVDEVRQAVIENRLEELLNTFEARTGDVVFVPAGTIHAIGSGIALYEVQEYSDVTYRLYDYGRLQANGKPRDLHIQRALDVMRRVPPDQPRATTLAAPDLNGGGRRTVLVACPYFIEEEWQFSGNVRSATHESSCEILTLLSDGCTLHTDHGDVALTKGNTVVLPAALGHYELAGQDVRLLRSRVPLASEPLVREWEALQVSRVDE